MPTSMKDLTALAAALDATVEDRGDAIEADAPKGMVFQANGCHCIVSAFEFEERPWPQKLPLVKGTMAAAREDMKKQLSYGTTRCTDDDCDICVHDL